MKRHIFFLLIIISLSVAGNAAPRSLVAYLSHSAFVIPGEGPYLETYLEIIGNTIVYKQTDNGKFQGNIQVTMIIKQNDEIKDFRKYELFSPAVSDTSILEMNFIDQQRFMLENGKYSIDLSIADLNVQSTPVVISYPVEINFPKDNISISGIQLVNKYTKTEEANPLSKSGYDIVPYVDNFFPADKNKLTYYVEIYNPLFEKEPDSKYLISTYIESFESKQILNNYTRIKRETASEAKVLLNEFDISTLPSGNYNLVVTIRNQKNAVIAQNLTFFQRFNPSVTNPIQSLSSLSNTHNFADDIKSADTLREYIRSLKPISTESERTFIKSMAEYADIQVLQQFFYRFWYERNEQNPQETWARYNMEVIKANNTYSTQVKKGYDTDMGRVYLQYGPPNSVTDVPFESSSMLSGSGTVPYQIWHYYDLDNGRQRNKKFVFASSELMVRDYTLIHSDAIGEIQNWGWQNELERNPAGRQTQDEFDQDRGRSATRYNNPY